jgi:hypothetical protein
MKHPVGPSKESLQVGQSGFDVAVAARGVTLRGEEEGEERRRR